MHAGRIVQVGEGEALYRAPSHPFVATFLGRVNRIVPGVEPSEARRLPHLTALWAGNALSADTPDALLVRPEDVEVGPALPDWGAAAVTRRSFLGDRVQLTLAVPGHTPLLADVHRDHPAREGEWVGFRIATHRLLSVTESLSA
ncbi:TOBE domain-containing protein [Acidovorax sp. NCPPB 3576]|nr:TOBE domain-containing protein [Acidovorax sp. NCPPB 3576]WCM90917.1 TOBE domain-containing protein [Acidovorax sp. NCPPB 3576]